MADTDTDNGSTAEAISAARERALQGMPNENGVIRDKSKKNPLPLLCGAAALSLVVAFAVAENKGTDAKEPDFLPATAKPPEQINYAAIKPASTATGQAPKQEKAQGRDDDDEANRRAQEERARAAALKQALARLQSPISVGSFNGNENENGTIGVAHPAVAEYESLGDGRDAKFFGNAVGKSVPTSKPTQIDNLEYKILKGKYIPLVVDPRAISDLAGQVCGRVDKSVFGEQGRHELIPWGSQVCGIYRAQLQHGQSRVFIVWNRLVRPDGLAINVDSPGVDQLGTAGMGGRVDNHFLEIFGNAILISVIGSGASTLGVGSGDAYNSAATYRENTQEALSETANSILSQYTNIPPTVITDHGALARVYVRRDLDFTPEKKSVANVDNNAGMYFEY